jgi:A/G-specific adenine glycosylase
MELGAVVCTPRAPRCELCPLASGCRARAAGESERYPVKRPRARSERHAWSAALVREAGRWLFVRRGDDAAILPGLWELPTIETERPEPAGFAARFGGEWRFGAELGRVRHAVTFRAIVLAVWAAEWTPGGIVAELPAARWLEPAEAGALALTGATRKLLAKLGAAS